MISNDRVGQGKYLEKFTTTKGRIVIMLLILPISYLQLSILIF